MTQRAMQRRKSLLCRLQSRVIPSRSGFSSAQVNTRLRHVHILNFRLKDGSVRNSGQGDAYFQIMRDCGYFDEGVVLM